jgi:hypothetical protein
VAKEDGNNMAGDESSPFHLIEDRKTTAKAGAAVMMALTGGHQRLKTATHPKNLPAPTRMMTIR